MLFNDSRSWKYSSPRWLRVDNHSSPTPYIPSDQRHSTYKPTMGAYQQYHQALQTDFQPNWCSHSLCTKRAKCGLRAASYGTPGCFRPLHLLRRVWSISAFLKLSFTVVFPPSTVSRKPYFTPRTQWGSRLAYYTIG